MAVTLFEQASHLGGRAAAQSHDGFWFNRGIHALYTGGAASEVLAELGIRYLYGIPRASFMLQRHGLYPFPASPLTLLGTRLLSASDKLELLRLLAGLWRMDPRQVAHTSVQDWVEGVVRRPPVRQLLIALARPFVYSAALDLVSAEVFVAKLQRTLTHPIHYIDGGWQTLVEALRRTAEAAGAHLIASSGTVQPGWHDLLVKRVYLPRIEAVGMLPTAQGGGFAGRPEPEVPNLANLYLAGDWIGGEGFLADASLASARQVAQLLVAHDWRALQTHEQPVLVTS